MNITQFNDLGLSAKTLEALLEKGYQQPTPIQSEAIPYGLEGLDFIGQSQTGTGKTMAFSIPIVERIDLKKKKIQALILCPTRELAVQVSSEINLLCKKIGVKSMAVYGGESIEKQIRELKRENHIVVGTPGRILDHIRRRTIKLDDVRFAVLDEADEMLDMGFVEDIESILSMTREDRQTMLFSATMPDEIKELANKYLKEPKFIKIKAKQVTVDRIQQFYIKVRNVDKAEVLSRLIVLELAKRSIVFCNTKRMVDELVHEMQERGYAVEGLHGDLKQQKRDLVMNQFKRGKIDILIATDVAARGLDIDDVDVVFNYDLPLDEEQYVHRIGRTGRAGKDGKAYSFVYGREIERLRSIERYAKTKVEERKIPRYKDIQELVIQNYIWRVNSQEITSDLTMYYNIVKQIKTFMNVETFLAIVLKEHLQLQEQESIRLEDYDRKERDKRSRDIGNHSTRDRRKRKVEKGMVRFHINVGKNHNVRVADLVGAIAGECNIKGRSIGAVDIYDKYSFFEIPEKYETSVIKNMKNIKIRGKAVTAQKSK
ncbi:MAG: DEAD/DEAH box helicase [Peptostreptococcaceae bacterium]|nr:DEAD/DEAH box helicase [Peptostreptococcaceae bacterium]